jgi:uncharacterized protein YecE (DUF72 family)
MPQSPQANPESFQFRNLHSQVFIGTASDRYAGWLEQIYSPDRYHDRITKRTKIIAGKSFIEEVLPVDSVEEYFKYFAVLEIDFTFYRQLLDQNSEPTQNYQVLKTYARHLKEDDRIILKVPQILTAQRVRKGKEYVENAAYLNPTMFMDQFYDPAVNLLGAKLTGFIFEQEYQRQKDRVPVNEMALALDKFFSQIPNDSRYHLELRTDLYLRTQIFDILQKHGVGQVLSHWTWLPTLRKQLAKADGRFFNAGNESVIRLLTPLGMRYEDSYEKTHPFDKLVEGMLQPEMILETVDIIKTAIQKDVAVNLIINNRAGGNAPLIAQAIAEKFLHRSRPTPDKQKSLW